MKPDFELIDTHAHLYVPEFDEDRDEMMMRARHQGVTHICMPNIDSGSIERLLNMESRYQESCHAMIGLHPCSVKADFQNEMDVIEDWLGRRSFSAIGEIGTDLYWDVTHQKEQILCLERQITWAKEKNLPVVLHSRGSLDLNIDIIRRHQDGSLRGVFHCFTGTTEQAKQIIDLGFCLGIGGVVTFKNSGLLEVVVSLPLDSIVLETDAPYLAPHPYRGKRNESSYLRLVAEKIAEGKGESVEKIGLFTTENAVRLFSLSPR